MKYTNKLKDNAGHPAEYPESLLLSPEEVKRLAEETTQMIEGYANFFLNKTHNDQ